MLRLHRLEISGFKSFVDPVATDFAAGITAIVGPNGCGKSNLAEAVVWALGEQSVKFLRGQRMEDVIFDGAQGRRPLGMAEVELIFLADPSIEAASDGTISIGRRVFRGGESQYRLNGKVVTLKEIRDLLMDTGLGIRAYSVIGQGQVETVLSGKPQERRKLIEEAAGITRYKQRKRLAELKLEEAVANLQRLDDIVSEVERSLRSLKRQANAARRYKVREGEYRRLLETVLVRKWGGAQAALAETREHLAALRETDAGLVASLHREEAALASGREEAEALAEAVSRRHSRQAELAGLIEGRRQFLDTTRRALEDARDRLSRGCQLSERLGEEIATHQATLSERAARRRELLSELGEARQAVAQDEAEIEEAQQALRAAEARLETLRAELLVSNGQITSLQARLHEEQIEGEKGEYRREHNHKELDRLEEQIETARRLLDEGRELAATLETRITAAVEDQGRAKAELETTLHAEAQASHRRDELRDERARLRQRRELLEELEAADEKRRRRLRETLAAAGIDEPRFLADGLEAPAGWEHSVDLYLEALRDAVLVPSEEDPLSLARFLAREGARGALLEPAGAQAVEPPLIDDPAVVASLGEALGLAREYARSLPPAFLVEKAQDAERLGRAHPGVAFLSRERVSAQSGLLRIQGREARPGALARRREHDDIAARLPELEEELAANESLLETLIGRRTLQAERSNELEKNVALLRQELALAGTRTDEARQRLKALEAEQSQCRDSQRDVMDLLGRIERRRGELRSRLEERVSAHRALEEKFDAAQEELESLRERRELVSTAGAGRRGRLDVLRERLEGHAQESDRLEAQIAELERRREEWRAEEEQLVARRKEQREALEKAEEELQQALEERSGGEGQAITEEERLREKREELRRLAESVEKARAEHETSRAAIEEERVREAARKQEAEHLAEAYEEKFGAPISQAQTDRAAADAQAQVMADDAERREPQAGLDELEEALEEHKRVLERLAPVNLLAADEYEEQEERHRFLSEQRADVQDSVDSLRRTIREINRTSSERFRETFDLVNENFAAVFTELFRGGEAAMRLLDEEDLLESGIEIMARPPGKRLQNISLLSGGEKALTAIALLFALFRTKPTPFCILDEVDAPLDDANILRFVELLRAYSREIQFLIITHNKLTMEAASTLYGVTMEERGVSKLVAVELDDIHPEGRLATA